VSAVQTHLYAAKYQHHAHSGSLENHIERAPRIIAPARSVGASYSESGVSNDLVCIHPVSDVRDEKTSKTPNGICAGFTVNLQR
jgi:hypothetical protein